MKISKTELIQEAISSFGMKIESIEGRTLSRTFRDNIEEFYQDPWHRDKSKNVTEMARMLGKANLGLRCTPGENSRGGNRMFFEERTGKIIFTELKICNFSL